MKFKNDLVSKTKELVELITEHPDLPVIPMVSWEAYDEPNSYNACEISGSRVTKLYFTEEEIYEYEDDVGMFSSNLYDIYKNLEYLKKQEPEKFESIVDKLVEDKKLTIEESNKIKSTKDVYLAISEEQAVLFYDYFDWVTCIAVYMNSAEFCS